MSAAPFSRLDPFDCKSGDFEYYLEQFDQFLAINSVADDEAKKVPLFIASIGQDAYQILKESCGEGVDAKEKSFKELRDLLLQYFTRRRFYDRNQRQGEYTGAFINEVQRLSLKCNFGPFQKEALRDRIACGRLPEEGADKKVVLQESVNPTWNPRSQSKHRQHKQHQQQAQQKQQQTQQQEQKQPQQQNQPKKAKNPQLAGTEPQEEEEEEVIPDSVPPKAAKKKHQPRQRQRKCKICGDLHDESECPEQDSVCKTQ